jgi:hypothetical protein
MGLIRRILFAFLNVIVVLVLALHFSLFASLHKGEDPMGLLITYPAAVVFAIIGLLMIVLGRSLGLSALGQTLPFIDMVYTFAASIIVANTLQHPLFHWVAAFGCVLLVALTGYTTVRTLVRVPLGGFLRIRRSALGCLPPEHTFGSLFACPHHEAAEPDSVCRP